MATTPKLTTAQRDYLLSLPRDKPGYPAKRPPRLAMWRKLVRLGFAEVEMDNGVEHFWRSEAGNEAIRRRT